MARRGTAYDTIKKIQTDGIPFDMNKLPVVGANFTGYVFANVETSFGGEDPERFEIFAFENGQLGSRSGPAYEMKNKADGKTIAYSYQINGKSLTQYEWDEARFLSDVVEYRTTFNEKDLMAGNPPFTGIYLTPRVKKVYFKGLLHSTVGPASSEMDINGMVTNERYWLYGSLVTKDDWTKYVSQKESNNWWDYSDKVITKEQFQGLTSQEKVAFSGKVLQPEISNYKFAKYFRGIMHSATEPAVEYKEGTKEHYLFNKKIPEFDWKQLTDALHWIRFEEKNETRKTLATIVDAVIADYHRTKNTQKQQQTTEIKENNMSNDKAANLNLKIGDESTMPAAKTDLGKTEGSSLASKAKGLLGKTAITFQNDGKKALRRAAARKLVKGMHALVISVLTKDVKSKVKKRQIEESVQGFLQTEGGKAVLYWLFGSGLPHLVQVLPLVRNYLPFVEMISEEMRVEGLSMIAEQVTDKLTDALTTYGPAIIAVFQDAQKVMEDTPVRAVLDESEGNGAEEEDQATFPSEQVFEPVTSKKQATA